MMERSHKQIMKELEKRGLEYADTDCDIHSLLFAGILFALEDLNKTLKKR